MSHVSGCGGAGGTALPTGVSQGVESPRLGRPTVGTFLRPCRLDARRAPATNALEAADSLGRGGDSAQGQRCYEVGESVDEPGTGTVAGTSGATGPRMEALSDVTAGAAGLWVGRNDRTMRARVARTASAPATWSHRMAADQVLRERGRAEGATGRVRWVGRAPRGRLVAVMLERCHDQARPPERTSGVSADYPGERCFTWA